MKRTANVGGVVANAVAIVAAILAFPLLVIPLMKLGLVGLLMGGPLAVVVYAVAFVAIDLGPLVGLAVGISGRARPLPWVTAALSLISLVALLIGVQIARGHVDLDNDGRAHGARPASCTPKSNDAAAVGRACHTTDGLASQGDCPDGLWCMEEIQGRPDTTCRLSCRHDCECPGKLSCKYEHCTAR